MIYYNYKKIVDLIQLIGKQHQMINSTGVGTIEQLVMFVQDRLNQDNTIDTYSVEYPLLYIIPEPAQTNGKSMTYSFDLICADITNVKNFEADTDVLSDTLQILEDVIAKMFWTIDNASCYYSWNISYPITFTPFQEDYADRLNGWTCKVEIEVPQPINLCDAPFTEGYDPCIKR